MSQTLSYLSGFSCWALTLKFDIALDVERARVADERPGGDTFGSERAGPRLVNTVLRKTRCPGDDAQQ